MFISKHSDIAPHIAQTSESGREIQTAGLSSVHAWRHVQSHVRVSTHVQNPLHERKIARTNMTIKLAITYAK